MKRELTYKDYAKNLTGEYLSAYERIHIYIQSAMSSGDKIETTMEEITDLLLSAQQDERSISSILGNDIELFCEGIVNETNNPLGGLVMRLVSMVFICVLVILVQGIRLAMDLIEKQENAWTSPVDISGFVVGLLVGVIVFSLFDMIMKKYIFHLSWMKVKTYKRIRITTYIASFIFVIVGVILIGDEIRVPRIVLLIFSILYTIIVTIQGRSFSKKHSLSNETLNVPKETISCKEELREKLIAQLHKRYEKMVHNYEKKGKEVISFPLWIVQDNKKYKRSFLAAVTTVIVIVVFIILLVIRTSTWYDSLMFLVILMIVESPLLLFMYKGMKMRVDIAKEFIKQDGK